MATTKTAADLLTHGDIEENFLTEYFTGTSKDGKTVPDDVLYIGDGIETAEPKQDDTKATKAYYNGGGQQTTTVTGSTRSIDFSGDRSIGDPAQDLIAGLADATGSARNKWFRENQYVMSEDGNLQLKESKTGMVTWSDITDKGGNATDPGSFKATATYTAKPTKATDSAALTTILEETPCVNSAILGVDASVVGATVPTGE